MPYHPSLKNVFLFSGYNFWYSASVGQSLQQETILWFLCDKEKSRNITNGPWGIGLLMNDVTHIYKLPSLMKNSKEKHQNTNERERVTEIWVECLRYSTKSHF